MGQMRIRESISAGEVGRVEDVLPELRQSPDRQKEEEAVSEEIKLRPEVLEFAQEMEKILRANDVKKGNSWKTMCMSELHECLNNEVDEYWAAETDEDSAKECVDAANILMMLYHRHKDRRSLYSYRAYLANILMMLYHRHKEGTR